MPDHTTAELARLVSQPHVVEILDILAEAPCSLEDLHRQLRVSRQAVTSALRVLAAAGVAHRHGHSGSWDNRPSPSVRHGLTATGRDLARQLDRLEVWTALYRRYLDTAPAKKSTAALAARYCVGLLLAVAGTLFLGNAEHTIPFGIGSLVLLAAMAYRTSRRIT
ncbi:hypothetical protein LCL61_17945 [Amycolatopsis coloradensis]|uniref:Uncharacterized protein n=1 Tax=Amycolatopsis coloradensis TaxID=76021 RepID=A0ACD5BDG4_9PSEU